MERAAGREHAAAPGRAARRSGSLQLGIKAYPKVRPGPQPRRTGRESTRGKGVPSSMSRAGVSRWDGARRYSVEGWGGTRLGPFSPLVMRCIADLESWTAIPRVRPVIRALRRTEPAPWSAPSSWCGGARAVGPEPPGHPACTACLRINGRRLEGPPVGSDPIDIVSHSSTLPSSGPSVPSYGKATDVPAAKTNVNDCYVYRYADS